MYDRKKPADLIAHERLLSRLPQHHSEYDFVKEKLYQLDAGYAGELRVDKIIPEIHLPQETKIIADLSFEFIQNHFIQIDTLILTKKGIIMLEIKNYAAGKVDFNEDLGKTVRTTHELETKMFDCAVDQVDRTVQGLNKVLYELEINLPVFPIIVMANPQAIVVRKPKNLQLNYTKQLPRKIRMLLQRQQEQANVQIEEIYEKLMKSAHKRTYLPLCQRYGISMQDLRKGVLCNQCNLPIVRKKWHSWKCENCERPLHKIAEDSLLDWFYLVDGQITNRAAREFFELENARQTNYFLTKANLMKKGHARGRYYELNM